MQRRSYAQLLHSEQLTRNNRLRSGPIGRCVPNRLPRLKFIDPEIVFIKQTIKIICEHFGYAEYLILSGRNRKLTNIKFIIFYLCYHIRSIPSQKIVDNCKGKFRYCHSNVIYGSKKINKKLAIDLNLSKQVQHIRQKLNV